MWSLLRRARKVQETKWKVHTRTHTKAEKLVVFLLLYRVFLSFVLEGAKEEPGPSHRTDAEDPQRDVEGLRRSRDRSLRQGTCYGFESLRARLYSVVGGFRQ